MKIEIDFKPYNGAKAWILFISTDKKSWWTEVLCGYMRIEDTDDRDPHRHDYWVACYYSEDGYVSAVTLNYQSTIVFDEPTLKDAMDFRDNAIIKFIGGDFPEAKNTEIKQEVLAV